jgi:hypothetical protein
MKRYLFFFIFCSAALLAQAEIVLQNGENAPFYYILAPLGENGRSDLVDDPSKAMALLKEKSKNLSSIPPSGAAELSGASGPVLVLGFFVSPGTEVLPLIGMKIPKTEGRQTFTASKSYGLSAAGGTRVTLSSWDINFRNESIQIDNRYLDWLKVPDLARFSASFTPVVFTRETQGKAEALPIVESMFWKKGGTQIESFKALLERNKLFIMASGTSEIVEGLSLLLYCYENRSDGAKAKFTIEIPIRFQSGPVLLWKPGEAKPKPVGAYVKSAFFLEAEVDLSSFPEGTAPESWTAGSFDLSSCFFGAGFSEEFFFSTINFRDVPIK